MRYRVSAAVIEESVSPVSEGARPISVMGIYGPGALRRACDQLTMVWRRKGYLEKRRLESYTEVNSLLLLLLLHLLLSGYLPSS